MKRITKKLVVCVLTFAMMLGIMPMNIYAAKFDANATGNYYNVLSKKDYNLVPGATESEIVINNAEGTRRQVLHVFEVDPKNPAVSVVPGYNKIDQFELNPTDVNYQSAAKVTDMAAYYEKELGYNVVGGMNIALSYDTNAPYTYLMYNGVVLQDMNLSYKTVEGAEWKLADAFYNEDGTVNDAALNQHSGSCATYLAIKKDGTFELRSASEPFEADDWNAIGANFGWCVKDGKNTASEERTSSPASRSMVGIKEDGTLVMCMADGRGANSAVGLSNYELGEMMLALGCKWAFNGDGGGSSTFISQREGEEDLTMRSVPSDGAERPTIHAIMIVSNLNPTGVFDKAVITSEYDYFAPGTTYTFEATGLDTGAFAMDIPAEATWSLSDASFGEISNGTFVSNGKLGQVDVQMEYNGLVVGSYTINVVNPKSVKLVNESTVIPYGKSVNIDIEVVYGADDTAVFYDASTFAVTVDKPEDCTLEGLKVTSPTDESKTGVVLTISYKYDDSLEDLILTVNYGKGSEIIWDFEDGQNAGFVGFDEAKAWSLENGLNNSLVGTDPLAGQYSEQVDGDTYVATTENGQVRSGNHSLAWVVDNTEGGFNGWTYNILFNIEDVVVFRDVANGKNATALGMWVYIPKGATGLAFQSQLNSYADHAVDNKATCVQDHFMFTTVSGVRKSLNNCTEEDIPESRWVYASIDISKYDYLSTMPTSNETNSRTPSFIRTYVKPPVPAVHTFYIDDITLDYSAAVDDREAPTISNPSYVPNDESVSFDNVATVNTMSFTATIEDVKAQNTSGIDYDTAMIYVDGRPVEEVVASGNTMSTKNPVTLSNGQHTVTFEIADYLGNTSEITKELTVEATNGNESLVSIGGHNDGNNVPMYDSIYYVDINVADVNNVEEIYARIQLNTANTWEIVGTTTIPGFTVEDIYVSNSSDRENAVTYSIRDIENTLYIHLVKNDDCVVTGEQTVASIPVRVWSWNAVDHTNGQEQGITINNQIVNIDYEVLEGYVVTDVENDEGESFYGKQSVVTEIQNGFSAYHLEHTVTELEDKAKTCTEDGYTGRTYCEVCKSVIDWGTIEEATGHKFEMIDYKLQCHCGEIQNVTGLIEIEGDTYYAISGNIVSGWQEIDGVWHYFRSSTRKAANGKVTCQVMGQYVTYTFNEDGSLAYNPWVKYEEGSRYFYGPKYYATTWATIEGEKYYFDANGYAYTGYQIIKDSRYSHDDDYRVYKFAADGKLEETLSSSGFLRTDDGIFYLKDGYAQYAGLISHENEYYYFNSGRKAVTGSYYVEKNNGLLPVGTYVFGADGKMLKDSLNGIVGDYYYINAVLQKGGLTKVGDDYYYFSTTDGKMSKNVTKKIYYTVCDLPTGTYTFGADGKVVIEKKNGIIGDYYYIDGVIQQGGLTKVGDDYYYFSTTNGKMSKNVTKKIYYTVCDLPTGTYTFGADGKVVFN